ncbi:peptidylprolyl isomerase [Maribacter hydrothermalis]|uniref:Peptidylprolyl isomerase n=1 Tax=Maribacter hydrothermalis TaxID=1836467 RepID=A0A1B7Z207_9FLAO|nr:peptidylprolyl isomerase [Maribacter hydrothermalis]APQ18340.1 peptidylprolyl isomerase [Maribacter hydrothermalis]OBR36686.1 peptidylprolyl isomerase [Maribacter hydrothermalis]
MFSNKSTFFNNKLYTILSIGLLFVILISCDGLFKQEKRKDQVARVGNSYLYKEDLAPLITENMSKGDSASFAINYINNWASKQLLLSKAKINLSEEKLAEYNALVDDYRTDLYTRVYKEALVSQATDSIITNDQLNTFYDQGKENFKLKERIARIRFVALPKGFLDKDEVSKRLKRFEEEDVKYLDSIGVHFKKLNFNDSIWVRYSRIFEEIPPITIDNVDKYLKNSQFFELEDSIGVYLGKIEEIKDVNEIAPLSFIKPTIEQVLLSRRKMDYLRKLESELLDEAIKDKEFEVFENKK